jgi:hypothetical protein
MNKIENLKSKLTWPWIVTGIFIGLFILIMIFGYFTKGSWWGRLKAESFYNTAFDVVLDNQQFKDYAKEVSEFLQRPVEIDVLTFWFGNPYNGPSKIPSNIDLKRPGNFFFAKSTPSFIFRNFNRKDLIKGLKTLHPIEAEEEVEEIEKVSDGEYLSFFIVKVKWESMALRSTFETADIIASLKISIKRGKIDRNIKNLPSQCESHFFEPHSLAQVQRQLDSFLGFLDKSTNILTPQNNRYYLIDQRAGQYRVARKIEEMFDVSHGSLINNYLKRIDSFFYTDVDSPHTYNLYNKNTYSLMPNYFLNLPYVFKSSESNSGNLCVLEVPVGVDGTPKDDWQTIVSIDLNKGELNRRDILPINSIDLTPELINQFLAGEFRSSLTSAIYLVFFILFVLVIYLLLGIIYRIKKIFSSQKVKVQRIMNDR